MPAHLLLSDDFCGTRPRPRPYPWPYPYPFPYPYPLPPIIVRPL
jgi:hypothetical protein